MPCSRCGKIGHNIRTCPEFNQNENINVEINPEINQEIDPEIINNDDYFPFETLILMEKCIREFIISDKIKELDDEQIKLYENCLHIKKKELKLINLEDRPLSIYIVEGNSIFTDFSKYYNIRYLGTLFPRSLLPLTSFTGYRYIVIDTLNTNNINIDDHWISFKSRNNENKYQCNIDIGVNEDNININLNNNRLSINNLNTKNKTLFSLIKTDYLIKQIIRLGGMDNPNFEAILDLHQDIDMPEIEPIDLEAAGIPNEFTNIN